MLKPVLLYNAGYSYTMRSTLVFPETLTDKLNSQTIQQAVSLDADERMTLFLTYVSKAKQIWLRLGEEGFVMLEDPQGALLPVWPHADLVESWDRPDLPAGQAHGVSLQEFVETWLPGLEKNATRLVIFPCDSSKENMQLSAEELKLSLLEYE